MSTLWIVLVIAGVVQGTWGPQPSDANLSECSTRAAAFQRQIRDGMAVHPDIHFPGDPSADQVLVICVHRPDRPALGSSWGAAAERSR